MTGAINFVEVIATLYVVAIIVALAYATFRAWLAKRDALFLRSMRRDRQPLAARSHHSGSTIST